MVMCKGIDPIVVNLRLTAFADAVLFELTNPVASGTGRDASGVPNRSSCRVAGVPL